MKPCGLAHPDVHVTVPLTPTAFSHCKVRTEYAVSHAITLLSKKRWELEDLVEAPLVYAIIHIDG